MTVPEDRIENEIVIVAPIERVWAVVTEAEHMGNWFGIGEPAKVDLRPGGEMVIVHNRSEHGTLVARIERVEPPRFFSYRWSQSHPEEQLDDGNSTLVEFSLSSDGDGTRLRVVESGFSRLTMPADVRHDRHQQNGIGWRTRALPNLRQYAEQIRP